MANGRKTGGRQKGTPNRRTAEQSAALEASGLTPLAFMMAVLRDEDAPKDERMDAAKAAAPYVHARLSNVEGTFTVEPYDNLSDDDLDDAFAAIAAELAHRSNQDRSGDRAPHAAKALTAKPH